LSGFVFIDTPIKEKDFMLLRTVLLLSFFLSGNSLASETVKVSYDAQTQILSYDGDLTEDGFAEFKRIFSENKQSVKWVDIKSKGGEINVGMDFGDLIHSHGLNLSVAEYCLSSCANYVFTAAVSKKIGKHALIGFHGGASSQSFNDTQLELQIQAFPPEQQAELRRQMTVQLQAYIERSEQRERAYFEKIGVKQEITTLGQTQAYTERYKAEQYIGWYYTVADLEKLGVKNITVVNPPWELRQLNEKVRVFLVTVDS
jgi:hypothetical protein